MKSFSERFRNRIDATNGTVVLREDEYKQIQRDALKHAAEIAGELCSNERCEGGCSWCRAKERAYEDIESALNEI